MTGKSHNKIALSLSSSLAIVATASSLSLAFNADGFHLIPILWIPLSAIGGYLPDIDKRGSTARKVFTKFCYAVFVISTIILLLSIYHKNLLAVVSILVINVCLVLLILLLKKSKHRHETHSVAFVAFSLLIAQLFKTLLQGYNVWASSIAFNLLIGVSIGIVSHIFIDEFNDRAMSILYPLEAIKKKKIIPALKMVTTSSPIEKKFINMVARIMVIGGVVISAFTLTYKFRLWG